MLVATYSCVHRDQINTTPAGSNGQTHNVCERGVTGALPRKKIYRLNELHRRAESLEELDKSPGLLAVAIHEKLVNEGITH
jgi:hypothetical protein